MTLQKWSTENRDVNYNKLLNKPIQQLSENEKEEYASFIHELKHYRIYKSVYPTVLNLLKSIREMEATTEATIRSAINNDVIFYAKYSYIAGWLEGRKSIKVKIKENLQRI